MMALGYAGHPGIPLMMPGMGWAVRPFSHEEHTTFLDAMERYGQENTGREWEQIAQAVGNCRTTQEVRMHAHEYFVSLQMVTQAEPDGRVLGTKIKKEDWTYEQDMVFEHAMAEFEETDPLRWLKVASLLPGKNHDDVRHRYQRLVYDVHKIEIAIPMEVKYRPPKPGKSLLAKVAQKSTSSVNKPRGMSINGVTGGILFMGRDGAEAATGLNPGKPSKTKLALMRLEELEKEVKPSKPFKTKIKGKGGGYILNTRSSSPRPPRAGGNRIQRATSTASSSSEGKAAAVVAPAAGNSKGGVSATGTKGGVWTGTRGDVSATGTRGGVSATGTRGGVSATGTRGGVSATGTRGGVSATGPKGGVPPTRPKGGVSPTRPKGGVSPTRTKGGVSPTRSKGAVSPTRSKGGLSPTRSKGGASPTRPKVGAGGKGAAEAGAAGPMLKRTAVTRLASLKSAKAGKGSSSRRPLGERGAGSRAAPGRGGGTMVTRGSRNLGRGRGAERPRVAKVVPPRRKSERTRKRRMLDGQTTEPEDEETEDEVEVRGGSHALYNLRR